VANQRRSIGKPSDVFPNILLQTQDGKPVRFYDDLVKGKTVLVNFIYTSCEKSCSPTTANLARVHALLGDRVGRDLILLSISLDPTVDRPETLKEYAARFGQFNSWYFLTGNQAEIDHLRRSMGLYDLDPVRDADKTQHAGIVIVGNDATNRWASLPALMDHRQIAQTVLRITRNRSS
jgi:protein SCO1/2